MSSTRDSRDLVDKSPYYAATLTYLLVTVFLVPSGLRAATTVMFVASLAALILTLHAREVLRVRLPSPLLLATYLLVVVTIAIMGISPYPATELLTMTAFLLVAVILFAGGPGRRLCAPNSERLFYIGALCVVVVSLGSLAWRGDDLFVFSSYDKNYFGVVLYLFFTWCWLTRRRVGAVICVMASALLGSRNYLIMLTLFFALYLFQGRRERSLRRENRQWRERSVGGSLRPMAIFGVFVLMLILIGGLSVWWSGSMVGSATTAYQGSINDSSNAIRFGSNVYALERLWSHPELLFYGYDRAIFAELGISLPSAVNDSALGTSGVAFNGYRVVQPHNVVLNLLVKEGVAYSICYFSVLSLLLAKYCRSSNYAYWLPYLAGCMFMHSLLTGVYLLFFLMVLSRQGTIELRTTEVADERPDARRPASTASSRIGADATWHEAPK